MTGRQIEKEIDTERDIKEVMTGRQIDKKKVMEEAERQTEMFRKEQKDEKKEAEYDYFTL